MTASMTIEVEGQKSQVPLLSVRNLHKTYGSGATAVTAISDISFDVIPGEFLSIVGPSGCGKTTLLRSLAGLQRPTGGTLEFAGRPIDGPPRGLGMVFQDYSRSLMPWLTVRKNITFPLTNAGMSRQEANRVADEYLEEVGVGGFGDKYPWQLSGGMQQRVAIARALAYKPQLLLMDEPFASVDAQTRFDLEDLLLKIKDDLGITILFVTHDIEESVYLGDRVVVLCKSPSAVDSVVDVDLPRPRNQFETKELSEFMHLRNLVFRKIKAQEAVGPA